MSTPRYSLNAPRSAFSDATQTFELAVARENLPRKAIAYLAIDATSFASALAQAIEWSKRYNVTNEFAVGKRAFPAVQYRGERRLAKAVNGCHTFIEGERMGWYPIDSVSPAGVRS